MLITKKVNILDKCPTCGGDLDLIRSEKNGQFYLLCLAPQEVCNFIGNAEKTNVGWRIKQDITDLNCLKCQKSLRQIHLQGKNIDMLVCSAGKDECNFVIFAKREDILGVCECRAGYVYKGKTKKGTLIHKCNVCDFHEYPEEVGA